jgi:hypothetical protein
MEPPMHADETRESVKAGKREKGRGEAPFIRT